MVDAELPEPGLFPQSVGERLRVMREAAGLDLNDVGTKTRIPLRHLEAIERGDYASLPSPTYALGFTRSYARAVGADDVPLIAQLRIDLGREDPMARGDMPYEPADPARVPGRLLAWTAAALALVLAIGYWTWRSNTWGPDAVTPVPTETPTIPPIVATNATAQPGPVTAPVTGEVVLTATAPVWLRVYDASKTKLFEKEMTVGERYVVPANANNPMILTGRPDGLKVTVGGREVAPLGTAEKSIMDVGISAAALAARQPVTATPTAGGPTPPAPAR